MAASSDSDANDLSLFEDRLFEARAHSVEEWAYGNSQGSRRTRGQPTYHADYDDLSDDLNDELNEEESKRAAKEAAAAAAAAAAAGPGRRNKKKKKKIGLKTLKNSRSRKKKKKNKKKMMTRSSISSRSGAASQRTSSKLLRQSREVWRPAPAKSPTIQQRTKSKRKAQEASFASMSPERVKKPSVSKLNLSNLNRNSAAATATATAAAAVTPGRRTSRGTSFLNQSASSARSFSALSTYSQRSGRGRSSKEAASLRLRLTGTQNAMRALQEQLHERNAEIDELRAQLLSKTRALEASRSFAAGRLDQSYVSRASGHTSGKEAQARRKYDVKLQSFEKECDAAVSEARKKHQRAVEINADLRTELERLRNSSSTDRTRLQEMNAMLEDAQRTLQSERRYSTTLASQQLGSEIELEANIGDLMTPDVTVRMLRQEISRLRSALSLSSQENAQQESRTLQMNGRSKQLEKENSALRSRAQVGALSSRTVLTNAATTLTTSKRLKQKKVLGPSNAAFSSTTNKQPRRSASRSPQVKTTAYKKKSPRTSGSSNSHSNRTSGARSPGIVESIAAKSTVEAQRYAKLKRMYDRAHSR